MITGILIQLFSTVIGWLLSLISGAIAFTGLPVTLGSSLDTAIQQIGTYLHTYDYFFPVQFTLAVVFTSIGIQMAMWVAKATFWIIRTIRGG